MKINKFRCLIIFLIVFFVVFAYLPVIKCLEDEKTKESVCKDYGTCKTDVYYSVANLFSETDDGEMNCPGQKVTYLMGAGLLISTMILSAFMSFLLEFFISKYRDI